MQMFGIRTSFGFRYILQQVLAMVSATALDKTASSA